MNFSGLSKILGGKFSNNVNYCHPKACILALNQDVYGYNLLNILNSLKSCFKRMMPELKKSSGKRVSEKVTTFLEYMPKKS